MQRTIFRDGFLALISAATAVAATGCESDGGTTIEKESSPASGSNESALVINMGDYYFEPANGTANSGPTKIEAVNLGKVEHELVVFKTEMNPAELPTGSDGAVEEEKMDKIAESAGEVPDVEAGVTKSADFNLKPGKYAIFCNLPGHYAQGMYGSLTVGK